MGSRLVRDAGRGRSVGTPPLLPAARGALGRAFAAELADALALVALVLERVAVAPTEGDVAPLLIEVVAVVPGPLDVDDLRGVLREPERAGNQAVAGVHVLRIGGELPLRVVRGTR